MKHRIIILAAAMLVTGAVSVPAQEAPESTSNLGPYSFHGNLTAGSKIANVDGLEGRTSSVWAERLFHEQFQYDPTKVAPTFSLNLFGEKPKESTGLFDQAFLNASYDGANALGSLRMRTHGLYDFKLSFTRSTYFFDRYDSIFSDLRQFDQARSRFSASLAVTPLDMLDVQFLFSRNERSGNQEISRSPFLELPQVPSTVQWAGYARGNFYRINYPTNDATSRFQGQVTARLPMTSLTAGAGYRTFTDNVDASPVKLTSMNLMGDSANGYVNEFGIIGTSRINEPLSGYHWFEERESKGPYAFGEVVVRPLDMLTATASVNYQKIDGTTTVDALEQGTMRKNSAGTQLKAFQATYKGESDTKLDRTDASFTLAVTPIRELQISGGFKYKKQDQTSLASYHGTLDTVDGSEVTPRFAKVGTDSIGHYIAETEFATQTQTYLGDIVVTPLQNLVVRGGIRHTVRTPDVTRFIEHELDSAFSTDLSRRSQFTTITGSVFVRPIPELRVRARVTSLTGKSYDATVTETELTHGENEVDMVPRRTPTDDLRFDGSIDAVPLEWLTLSLGASFNEGSDELTPFTGVTVSDARPYESTRDGKAFSFNLGCTPIDELQLSLRTSYDESNYSIPVTWTRAAAGGTLLNPPFGTSPVDSLTTIVEERTIDRIYTAGASVTPIEGLSIGADVDYIRSTGGSFMSADAVNPARLTIIKSDAPRMNGPMTRWQARGHVAYDVIPSVGVSVDALFVNQEEDKVGSYVALNNFKANVITLSLIFKL
jgi:hypothetical protein